jgi:hypothetical protein
VAELENFLALFFPYLILVREECSNISMIVLCPTVNKATRSHDVGKEQNKKNVSGSITEIQHKWI